MITQDEIQRLAKNKYQAFLRSAADGSTFFPLHVRFGHPRHTESLADLTKQVQALLAGSKDQTGHGYTVRCEPVNTRRYGQQPLPVEVSFTDESDYVKFIGKVPEVERFRRNLELARALCPSVQGWLVTNVAKVVANERQWSDLMRVCAWFSAHPRPGCYAREIPVPVHTKFVEENQPVLRSLLEYVLPNDFDPEADDFYSRFYLRDKEALIRLRVLDSKLIARLGLPFADFSVPVSGFNSLPFAGVERVLITENELPLLTLPAIRETVAIFGRGNAVRLIASAKWLRDCTRVFYWGDLDAAGFAILARLRQSLPHVHSVLMERATLDGNTWAQVKDQSRPGGAIPQDVLTEQEWQCWRHVLSTGTRLEQERIPLEAAHRAISEALDS